MSSNKSDLMAFFEVNSFVVIRDLESDIALFLGYETTNEGVYCDGEDKYYSIDLDTEYTDNVSSLCVDELVNFGYQVA